MATTVKDAIKAFETSAECVAADAEDVRLCPISLQLPLIAKMDGSLGTLKACKHLRLSTNAIDKISNLNGLDNLEILSLGRNAIKSLNGIDPVADTLKQLWISYNQIASLAGVEKLQNLEVLFMSNNKIGSWSEVERLASCSKLRDLLLKGNPLEGTCNDSGEWRCQIIKRLPGLKVRACLVATALALASFGFLAVYESGTHCRRQYPRAAAEWESSRDPPPKLTPHHPADADPGRRVGGR